MADNPLALMLTLGRIPVIDMVRLEILFSEMRDVIRKT
jgi:hypothetical protein